MTKEQWNKILSIVLVAVVALLGVFGYDLAVIQPRDAAVALQAAGGSWLPEQPGVVSRGVGYNTACYLEQGGSQITGDSGCTVQLNSGATLDMNAGTLQFEGATADDYETTFAITDPTADRTITIPNSSGTVALNPAAGSWEFEGTTADDYETTLSVTDPTADNTVTIPNLSGTVMLTSTGGKWIAGVNAITGTLTISHGLTTPQTVLCTLIQDAEANNASCSATISGSTVVVKTWKADGATPASVGKLVSWLVGGQP